jgi:hypothetical protein
MRLFSLSISARPIVALIAAGALGLAGCSSSEGEDEEGVDESGDAITVSPSEGLFAELAGADATEFTPTDSSSSVQKFAWTHNGITMSVVEKTEYSNVGNGVSSPTKGTTYINGVAHRPADGYEAWKEWRARSVYTRFKAALVQAYVAAPQSAFVPDQSWATWRVCKSHQLSGIGFGNIESAPARFQWNSELGPMVVCDYSHGKFRTGGYAEFAVGIVHRTSGLPLTLAKLANGVVGDMYQ